MEVMERSKPRARRSFTPEFKAEIVELCQRGDRSIGQVARDFDLTETAVRAWVRQAERDAGSRGDGGLTSAERQELAALRRENRRLRDDVEILERATAFFAKVIGELRDGATSPGRVGTRPGLRCAVDVLPFVDRSLRRSPAFNLLDLGEQLVTSGGVETARRVCAAMRDLVARVREPLGVGTAIFRAIGDGALDGDHLRNEHAICALSEVDSAMPWSDAAHDCRGAGLFDDED